MPLTALDILPLARQLADPRGRCNRQTFLYVAVAFLILQLATGAVLTLAGVHLTLSGSLLINAPIMLIGAAISVKRVHDIGYSGWILVAAIAVWLFMAFLFAFLAAFMFGLDALEEGSFGYMMLFASIMLPALGGLVWLHATAGLTVPNAFGAVPTTYGLAPSHPRGAEAGDAYDLSSDGITA